MASEELRPEAAGPSFTGAPRWPVSRDEVRLRMSDRMVSRWPGVMRAIGERVIAAPRGSRSRRRFLTRSCVAGFAAWDAREYDYLERIFAPDVRYEMRVEWFDLQGVFEGWAALREHWLGYQDVLGPIDNELTELIDVGGPYFALGVTMRAAGRTSGIDISVDLVVLCRFERGVATHYWNLPDEQTAAQVLAEHLAGA
jgi:hypothetical protein